MTRARPSYDELFMSWATGLSARSTCTRLTVGCVVVSSDNTRVLAMGYNGGAAGQRNECLSDLPGSCGHLHAEVNALVKMDYGDPRPKRMYVTVSPCLMCAIAIVNARVGEVIYGSTYRDPGPGLDVLEAAGIVVRRFPAVPDGAPLP